MFKGAIVKARRTLKKLDKKAYDQGVLGGTGNPYVQAKNPKKTENPVMLNDFERQGLL